MKKQKTCSTNISKILVSLVLFFSLVTSAGKAQEGVTQSKDTEQIQEVIRLSYALEANAGRTFDTSSFTSVFINDLRGGELSSSTRDFIADVTQDGDKVNYGYLDYKISYFAWWKTGALKYEALKLNADKESRSLTTNEMKSLMDEKGRMAMPRLQGEYVPAPLTFLSIDIKNDSAIVIFDDGARTNQMTLVKVENRWFIAGNKFLSINP